MPSRTKSKLSKRKKYQSEEELKERRKRDKQLRLRCVCGSVSFSLLCHILSNYFFIIFFLYVC